MLDTDFLATRPAIPVEELVALLWQDGKTAPPPPRTFATQFLGLGFVGPLLVLLALWGAVLCWRRRADLYPVRLAPPRLLQALEHALASGEIAVAGAHASASMSSLGSLVARGLQLHAGGLDEMLANCERAAMQEMLRLGDRIAAIARLGAIVLLLGALGTVLALLSAADRLGVMRDARVQDYTAAVGEALTNIAFAAFAALLLFAAFFALQSRLVHRLLAVRETAEDLLRRAASAARARV
jgi:biopolymer transport protein ExbB/TolQ